MSVISEYKIGTEHFRRKEYAQAVVNFETGTSFGSSSDNVPIMAFDSRRICLME